MARCFLNLPARGGDVIAVEIHLHPEALIPFVPEEVKLVGISPLLCDLSLIPIFSKNH